MAGLAGLSADRMQGGNGEEGGARTRFVPMHGRRRTLWSGGEGAAWHSMAQHAGAQHVSRSLLQRHSVMRLYCRAAVQLIEGLLLPAQPARAVGWAQTALGCRIQPASQPS